jgi:type I restriction enzyme S subunit
MSMSDEELRAKSLIAGDILVCEGGDVGRSAVWTGGLDPVSFQNHLHRLRPFDGRMVPRFLVFFLQSAFTQLGIFEGAANDTTIPNLSRNRLFALEVPVPPIKEQLAIVNVLACVREALKLEAGILERTKELKQVAMRELFTRGLRGEAEKESVVGRVPASWEITELGALCSAGRGRIQTGPFGSQLHAYEYQADGIAVVNPTHLEGNRINHTNVPRVSAETGARLDRHVLQRGDILFARRGEIGRLGLVGETETGWLCGTGCFLVRVDHPGIVNAFLARFFSREDVVSWLSAHAAGAIMPNLNGVVLGRLPVAIPTLSEQDEIVAILNAIDEKIDLHRKRRSVLEDLFKSLLHKLMTGEIRVSDLDLSALEQTTTAQASA